MVPKICKPNCSFELQHLQTQRKEYDIDTSSARNIHFKTTYNQRLSHLTTRPIKKNKKKEPLVAPQREQKRKQNLVK